MKKVSFFGGSSGLGKKVIPHLNEYSVDSLSSRDVNFLNKEDVDKYFEENTDTDIVVIFSNYNFNSYLHKYNLNFNELKKQIDINVLGVSYCISRALENMRKNKYGRIIIASSVTVDTNIPGTSIYAASKSFYENLVRTLSKENGSYGITINCIKLGYMDGGLAYTLPEDFLEKIKTEIPLKRLGSPEEIANTIRFLIETEYVNGSTVELTGGL